MNADLSLPVDALARLAVAAGYTARGDDPVNRALAEHHLGMALSIFSRGGESPAVTVAEAEGLLRLIAAIAQGTPKSEQKRQLEEPSQCVGRVVGPYGMIERCPRAVRDAGDLCAQDALVEARRLERLVDTALRNLAMSQESQP